MVRGEFAIKTPPGDLEQLEVEGSESSRLFRLEKKPEIKISEPVSEDRLAPVGKNPDVAVPELEQDDLRSLNTEEIEVLSGEDVTIPEEDLETPIGLEKDTLEREKELNLESPIFLDDREASELDPETRALKTRIDESESIGELLEALNSSAVIKGSKQDIRTAHVIGQVREIDNFLNEHLDKVITGTIIGAGEFDHYRDELGKKLSKITRGGDLGIRQKVKELLKHKMEDRFLENRKVLVQSSIGRVKSFDELENIVKQFKGLNLEGEGGPRYSKEQAMEVINLARSDFDLLLADKNFVSKSHEEIERNIDDAIRKVPKDSGVRDKVKYLLMQKVKDAKLQEFSAQVQEPVGSRIKKRLFGFFKR